MNVKYKGFDIEASKERSVLGDELLYFSAFRKNDCWELTSGQTYVSESIEEIIGDMKKLVDEYLEIPQDFEDDLE